MIGKWIDGLTDEQRDRIIEHPDPTFDGSVWWSKSRDCGCLVGSVRGRDRAEPLGWFAREKATPESAREIEVGLCFVELTARFGAERIWRICKVRAARANRVSLPERVPEAVEAR